MEFLKVDSVEAAREKLLRHGTGLFGNIEVISAWDAAGRIAAADIYAPEDIPAFPRSTVDGYAVVSGDTAGAGENMPVFLALKGCVEMGAPADMAIGSGECAEVPTGGMLPAGADAVVMVEYTDMFGDDGVAVGKSVAHGENVVRRGEDAKAGDLLIRRGRRLLPQDIGALAAAGAVSVPVYVPPRMTVISTGDELAHPQDTPHPGRIRDINTYALSVQAKRSGFNVIHTAVLPDKEDMLTRSVAAAMEGGDIVIVSGGSSKGKKDLTGEVFSRLADPGVFVSGIAVKPGKPTILGYDGKTRALLVGLPGHPVSAMIVFELTLGWLLRELTGCPAPPPIPARLSCNLASSPGRLNCQPCRLIARSGGERSGYRADSGNGENEKADSGGGYEQNGRLAGYGGGGDERSRRGTDSDSAGYYTAQPVFGKSGLITTLTQADGYFMVDRGAEGLPAGSTVMVHLF